MVRTIFSNIREEISKNIIQATDEILVAVAWFTDDVLFDLLKEALNRKVRLSIILNDDDINQFSGLNFDELEKKGGSIYLYDSNDDTMHQKFCVIDNLVVFVGSYNWTKKAANRNTENVIIFDDDTETASKFKNQFYELIVKSKKFKKREKFNTPKELLIKDFIPITRKLYEGKKDLLFEETKNEEYSRPDLIPFRVGRKWGYCDRNRNVRIPLLFESARPFSEGLAAVKVNEKWGFIDSDGKKMCDCIYKKLYSDFLNGYASVQQSPMLLMERWGVIDRFGKIVIPFDYKRCNVFSEGLFCVSPFMYTWKFGFVNTKNQKVIPTIYDNASSFSDGMACVRKEMLYEKVKSKNDWFYINSKGERAFENGFYQAKSFTNGFAVVSSQNEQGIDSKYGLIGKNGKFKIEPQYSDMGHQYNDGLIPVAKKFNTIGKFGEYEVDKFGFVDINNNLIIPFKFDRAEPFSDSLAVVVKNGGKGKYGFIDMNGKIVVDYIFDFAHSFKNNLALVQIGENSGYIDSKGNQYWE